MQEHDVDAIKSRMSPVEAIAFDPQTGLRRAGCIQLALAGIVFVATFFDPRQALTMTFLGLLTLYVRAAERFYILAAFLQFGYFAVAVAGLFMADWRFRDPLEALAYFCAEIFGVVCAYTGIKFLRLRRRTKALSPSP